MADYDPKSIPILDDVIDLNLDEDETRRPPTIDDTELESEQLETDLLDTADSDNLDLFKPDTGEIEQDAENTFDLSAIDNAIDDDSPSLGVVEELSNEQALSDITSSHDAPTGLDTDDDEQSYESALIGYPENLYDEAIANATSYEKPTDKDAATAEQPVSDPSVTSQYEPESQIPEPYIPEPYILESHIPEPPAIEQPVIDIQPLVDNIVEQLLPAIEQQVRLHVEQVLQDNSGSTLLHRSDSREIDETEQE